MPRWAERVAGQRPGRRKPTQLYALAVRADHALSTAYIPVLRGLLAVLSTRFSPAAFTRLLGAVGRRLAAGHLPTTADRRSRAETAAKVLNELGGAVRVEQRDGQLVLRSAGCPLAELVRDEPGACRIVESLVTELVGVQAREVCERGERPRCAFVLDSPPPRVKRRR